MVERNVSLIDKLIAASHTEIFHGVGVQKSIALDTAISIVREHEFLMGGVGKVLIPNPPSNSLIHRILNDGLFINRAVTYAEGECNLREVAEAAVLVMGAAPLETSGGKSSDSVAAPTNLLIDKIVTLKYHMDCGNKNCEAYATGVDDCIEIIREHMGDASNPQGEVKAVVSHTSPTKSTIEELRALKDETTTPRFNAAVDRIIASMGDAKAVKRSTEQAQSGIAPEAAGLEPECAQPSLAMNSEPIIHPTKSSPEAKYCPSEISDTDTLERWLKAHIELPVDISDDYQRAWNNAMRACLGYVRTTKPVSVSLKRCVDALQETICFEDEECLTEKAKAVLNSAKEQGAQFDVKD